MKHHHHSIGWKRANRFDIPFWKEYLAIATCYLSCIGLVALVVVLLSK